MKIYLLKKILPCDPQNGVDMRVLNLCPFINEVFFVDKKVYGESGIMLEGDSAWTSTQLSVLVDLKSHLDRCSGGLWIAGDFESFTTLRSLGVRPVIYDGCDAQSLYFKRRFSHLRSGLLKKRLNAMRLILLWTFRERQISKYCAGVIVPANEDAMAFRRWSNDHVVVISNGTSWVEDPPIERVPNARSLLFHGAFSWPVNTSTAEYLVKELFPAVRKKVEGVELRIAGNPIPEDLRDINPSSGIAMEGYVEDIRSWLSRCGVYVMPMLQGGGVKNKLLEAMAAGLPIVTNTMGAEAMDERAKQWFVVADGTEAIAEAVSGLINDPDRANTLAESARQYAINNFEWTGLASKYRAVLSSLSGENLAEEL